MDAYELKSAREARGWSQQELGRRIGVAAGHISKWENGHCGISRGYELALLRIFSEDMPGNEKDRHLSSPNTDTTIREIQYLREQLTKTEHQLEFARGLIRDAMVHGIKKVADVPEYIMESRASARNAGKENR